MNVLFWTFDTEERCAFEISPIFFSSFHLKKATKNSKVNTQTIHTYTPNNFFKTFKAKHFKMMRTKDYCDQNSLLINYLHLAWYQKTRKKSNAADVEPKKRDRNL